MHFFVLFSVVGCSKYVKFCYVARCHRTFISLKCTSITISNSIPLLNLKADTPWCTFPCITCLLKRLDKEGTSRIENQQGLSDTIKPYGFI